MSDHLLMEIMPEVKTLVDACSGVKRGERVLIITDRGDGGGDRHRLRDALQGPRG